MVRLFLSAAAAPYTPATVRGAFDQTSGSPVTGKLGPKSGSVTAKGIAETSTTNNWDVLLGRWISDAILDDISISGNLGFCIPVKESSTSANDTLHLHLFVIAGDSDTVRGTLLTDYINASEFPTTMAMLQVSGLALSAVGAKRGDRIVLEVGYRAANTSATSYTGTINYGGTWYWEAHDGGTPATDPAWIEFDMDGIVFRKDSPNLNAIQLDGATQYGTVPNLPGIDALDGNLTMEAWVLKNSVGNNYENIFGIVPTLDSPTFGAILVTENNYPSAGCNFGYPYSIQWADGFAVNDPQPFPFLQWVHVAVVYTKDAPTVVFSQLTEVSYSLQNWPEGVPQDMTGCLFALGMYGLTENKWNGKIGGFVRVWKEARTLQQLTDNANLNLESENEPNLIINLKFKEGAGASIANEAYPANPMTLVGSPTWVNGPNIYEKSYGPKPGIIEDADIKHVKKLIEY